MAKFLAAALLAGQAVAAGTSATSETAIEVDVAIIGGGAAGTYAATRLVDNNKTVVLLERKSVIGGQTETYIEPETNFPVNVGLKVFTNTTATAAFLKRFNFEMGTLNVAATLAQGTVYVDMSTGEALPNYTTPTAPAQAAALQKYAAEVAKYPELIYGFNLASPVPEDLVLPFGEFVKKYELEDAVNYMYEYNQGLTPLMDVPTLYIMKYLNAIQLASVSADSFIISAKGDSHSIYDAAAEFLGDSVLYNVSGLQVSRNNGEGPVTINVGSSSMGSKIISAKRLIVAVPPTVDALASAGLDLDASEAKIFGKLSAGLWDVCIVKNSGITSNLRNRHLGNDYNFPTFPAIYSIVQIAGSDGLVMAYYGTLGNGTAPAEEVKADVVAAIQKLPAALRNNLTAVPEVVHMAEHTFNIVAPAEDIVDGYYDTLEALQGVKNTHYIGMAWATMSAATIWQGIEDSFLPGFLATF
ncbi:unnamed protein product [Discula destructiva]